MLPPTPFAEVERIRANIHVLLENGVFKTRNGNITLHFDSDGQLKQIEQDIVKWRKDKPLQQIAPGVKIDTGQLNTQTQTMSGTPR